MAQAATAAHRLLTGAREPVRAATTANVDLAKGGLLSVDGIALKVGDRVLVKNQNNPAENGIYTASAGRWHRASDARDNRTLAKGTLVIVESGAANGGKVFAQQTEAPDIGSDAMPFGLFFSYDTVGDVQAAQAAAEAAGINLQGVIDQVPSKISEISSTVASARDSAVATVRAQAAPLIAQAETAKRSAEGARDAAFKHSRDALAAAEATGPVIIEDDYATADANLPSYSEGQIVEILTDVNHGNARTRYRVVDGELSWRRIVGIDADDLVKPSYSTISRTIRSKLEERISVLDFGALGDGSGTTLAAFFGTLAEAQAEYPHATALTNTVDWCAFMAAFAYIRSVGGGSIYVPPGHYKIHTMMWGFPDNCTVYGDGDAVEIENINTGSDNRYKAVFDFGYLHPAHYGNRPIGSSDPFDRLLNRYEVSGVTETEAKVTLISAADASNFTVGELILIVDAESHVQSSTGVEIEVPINTTIAAVKSVNSLTGEIAIDGCVGFDAPSGYAVKIPENATDGGIPVRIVRNAHIRDLRIKARATVSLAAACYRSSISGLTGSVAWILQGNAFVQSQIRDINQEFTVGVMEIKFGAHDTTVSGIKGHCFNPVASSLGIMGVGEYCRNIIVDGFEIIAPTITGRSSFQIQPGTDCIFRNGSIYIQSSTTTPILFYADSKRPVERCAIENVVFHTGSRLGVSFASNLTHYPKQCRVRGCKLYSNNPDADNGGVIIAFDGGEDNEVIDCFFQTGSIIRQQSTLVGAVLKNNIFGKEIGFQGTGQAQNAAGVMGNWMLAGGVFSAVGRDGIGPDRGNADYTVVAHSASVQQWATPLTGTRTCAFNSTGMTAGQRFRIVRTATATGTSSLSVGGLKNLAAGEWAEVIFDGAAMILIGFGEL